MNKMSIDRFNSVGPLYPQNFQLIDTSGETMKILVDAPSASASRTTRR